ncbi:MAG: LacI family DNA-binding transcriptional regulator [Clostridia bacterium]|nr:LacI family DNA-binding transcriptional regulator [Clostridia bacterium]
MTLTKLAQLAGVSVSTVSKALSESAEISEGTRAAIVALAKEHGCYEKYYNPKYQKKLIAVLCPEILGNHYGRMANDMEHEIAAHGGTMVLSVFGFRAEKQRELVEYYTKFARADGIIVIEPAEKVKNDTDIPIVQIGPENESRGVDCVKAELAPAMEEAVRYLRKLGHRRIGFVGEELATPEYEAFLETVRRARLEILPGHVAVSSARFEEAGRDAMGKILSTGDELPTAVFAAYSHIALGTRRFLLEKGLSVPRDMSIICMDDILSDTYQWGDLSCIRMHIGELCASATELLFAKLRKGHGRTKRSVSVIREFSHGDTVAPPVEKT